MLNILSNAQMYLLPRDAHSGLRRADGTQTAIRLEEGKKQRSFSRVLWQDVNIFWIVFTGVWKVFTCVAVICVCKEWIICSYFDVFLTLVCCVWFLFDEMGGSAFDWLVNKYVVMMSVKRLKWYVFVWKDW